MNKTSSLIVGFISIALVSVLAGDSLWDNHKTWVESDTHILLLHTKRHHGYPYYSGTLRLISKRGGVVLFEKEAGYLTYIWISPDSKFIVGFSAIKPFYDMSGYNLVILNASGEILHKEKIEYGSKYVKNVSVALSEWNEFYDAREDPCIKLECGKLGNVIAISFNDAASERARIPLERFNRKEFEKKIIEDAQESINEMRQNPSIDPPR